MLVKINQNETLPSSTEFHISLKPSVINSRENKVCYVWYNVSRDVNWSVALLEQFY